MIATALDVAWVKLSCGDYEKGKRGNIVMEERRNAFEVLIFSTYPHSTIPATILFSEMFSIVKCIASSTGHFFARYRFQADYRLTGRREGWR